MVKSFLKEDSLSTCQFTTITLVRDHSYITSAKGRWVGLENDHMYGCQMFITVLYTNADIVDE